MTLHKLSRHLEQLDISAADCSGRIEVAASALSGIMMSGKCPSFRTASRIVAASNGTITYEDLLPTEVKRTNRKYRGRLAS